VDNFPPFLQFTYFDHSVHILTIVCCGDNWKGGSFHGKPSREAAEKMREGPRDRLSGAGLKPLQAAVVKSHSGERWSQSSRKYLEQVCVRETNESKPIEDASLNIQMSPKPGAYGSSGMSLSGA
jgi:hypothetical protein